MDTAFFHTPTLLLAKKLLGKKLVHETPEGKTAGLIVEVEAYMGPEDKAAHSYGGRKTERTKMMYDRPGLAYIFRIYGMHLCFNIVSGPVNKPEAVLVRALEPIEGIPLMTIRRTGKQQTKANMVNLTNGPGKLSQAMGITMSEYGLDLCTSRLRVEEGISIDEQEIATGPRINIDYAEEAIHFPWRFWMKDNPYVSKVPKRYRLDHM